jgi:hypothetical protein
MFWNANNAIYTKLPRDTQKKHICPQSSPICHPRGLCVYLVEHQILNKRHPLILGRRVRFFFAAPQRSRLGFAASPQNVTSACSLAIHIGQTSIKCSSERIRACLSSSYAYVFRAFGYSWPVSKSSETHYASLNTYRASSGILHVSRF